MLAFDALPRAEREVTAIDSSATESTREPSTFSAGSSLALLGTTSALVACGGGADADGQPVVVINSANDSSLGVGSESALDSDDPGIGDKATSIDDKAVSAYQFTSAENDAQAARFLQQAQFASTRRDIDELRKGSYAAWLNQQLSQPPGTTGWDWLDAKGYGVIDEFAYYNVTYPADFMIWSQLLSGEDPVRRRLALALSEYFVVSLTYAEMGWRSHVMTGWWDLLVAHACGNFRELLEAVTLSPAMGYFLNTRGNLKEDGKGRVPDENYAREVMQLFTIGLYRLNPDGSIQTDAIGNPVESYTQDDVTQLARVFTGYYEDHAGAPPRMIGLGLGYPKDFARRPMKVVPEKHSTLPVEFLGTSVPNSDGVQALRVALDTLFNHPNVGPFFGRQMIQRLVTSNPSPAYVARVAAAFNDNGSGVRGDLRAVWAAVLLDDEARDPAGLSDPLHGKLREPMLRFVQWARSFGVTSASGRWKLHHLGGESTQLAQSPLRAPSVFNFFRPGYVPPSTELATRQAVAPEFQLVSETSVGGYLNFMQGVIRDGIRCAEPSLPQSASTNYQYDVKASYVAELALVDDPVALVDHLDLVLCAGQLPTTQKTLMSDTLKTMAVGTQDQQLDRIAAAVLMVMASSAYLVQK